VTVDYDDTKFNKSHELHKRALKSIPLASQTFSKSAMNTVEGAAPLFLDRARGGCVWDVDDNRYVDYILALSPILLGYCDPDVDAAIRQQLDKGITFSLATELETELAERLIRLIPCAEMVRFGKNGSDATSAAIRLARAFTGRDHVALCGYHGWHDWYIGTTSRNLGVPDSIRKMSKSFSFNDLASLEAEFANHGDRFAAVILEPDGVNSPDPEFLRELRKLTDAHGVILVFDEIVTGFRVHIGGAQAKYGVTPDLACFGKAMGNGMPISAIVGRRDVMRFMEDIFFSGTFGGEALSLAAAIATIDKVEATDTIGHIHRTGERLRAETVSALQDHGLEQRFEISGPSWRPVVAAKDCEVASSIAFSLLMQELIDNGVLMGAGFNLCLAHDDSLVDETLRSWTQACGAVAVAFNDRDPSRHLRGKPIEPIFRVR